jgi:hypothetical protein
MRVNERQLSLITGRPPPPPLATKSDLAQIIEKLKSIEVSVFREPPPPPPSDMPAILARLDRLEAAIKAIPKDKPAWEFTVTRNAAGQIEKINATRKTRA